uniref:(northern house mosquito) hypothetical protein n=1 Tax=Culex pipiens TaxID=7175 RepID=A0A8D8KKM0_CULPI
MSSTQANFDEHSKLRNTVDCVGTCSSGHWSRRHRLHRLGLRRDGCGRVSRMAWGLRLGIVFWWMFTVGFGLERIVTTFFLAAACEHITSAIPDCRNRPPARPQRTDGARTASTPAAQNPSIRRNSGHRSIDSRPGAICPG